MKIFQVFFLICGIYCLNQYKTSEFKFNEDETVFEVKMSFNSKNFNINDYGIKEIEENANLILINDLIFKIELQCDSIIHFTIKDQHNQRFEPNITDSNYLKDSEKCTKNLGLKEFGFSFNDTSDNFGFSLSYNNFTYFSFNEDHFLYTDTFIFFEYLLTTDYIFGFGERNINFKLPLGKFTSWPNDTTHTYRDQAIGGFNLMGLQPISLHKAKNGLFIGFIFMNINAQDTLIKKSKIKEGFPYSIEHRTIGGIIDLYIAIGKTADEAIANIHKIIGVPTMPPFWSFGWNQCKWGYNIPKEVEIIYENYKNNSLPIDTLWCDIDMLEEKRNFLLSSKFKSLPALIQTLHSEKRHFVPIVDYGIPMKLNDKYYSMGIKAKGTFIQSNYTNTDLINIVWPGKCVFVDFFTKEGVDLWNTGLKDFDEAINYDGIWFDMNEPGVIEVLENGKGEIAENFEKEKNLYEYIPYIPGKRTDHYDLQTKTLSLNGFSNINDPSNNFYTIYNVKALISKLQVKITYDYLLKSNRRPFILSRSNVIGNGKYAFHWLGDNASTFDDLKASIAGIFAYNIFGIPMTGADICGFHEHTTDKLCARWHILGAFYPFSRNHNEIYKKSQEPFAFKDGFTLQAAKIAIPFKYSIIRYIYSQMMLISLGLKGSYFKPAFFEFPDDRELYQIDIMDTYIMAGSSLYFIPILSSYTDMYNGYFPNAHWNTFPEGEPFIDYDSRARNIGTIKKLSGDFNVINVFLRGGSIIPYQNPFKPNLIQCTYDLRINPIQLIINPDQDLNAEGEILYDNDEPDVISSKMYNHIKLSFSLNTLYFYQEHIGIKSYNSEYQDYLISSIKILRAKELQKFLGKKLRKCEFITDKGDIDIFPIKYDTQYQSLTVELFKKYSIFDLKLVNFYEY